MTSRTALPASFLLLLASLPAQTPRLLRDINTRATPDPAGSAPRAFANTATHTFFSGQRSDVGKELFVVDRRQLGTVRVIDIVSGGDSEPRDLTAVGNKVFFTATTPAAGRELWVSDGTPAGTSQVKDIWSGPNSADPGELTAVGGWLYFTATNPSLGVELWRSDGTPRGTDPVQIIVDKSGPPRQLTASGLLLYYTFSTNAWGEEVWVTDGTSARMAGDVAPGKAGSAPVQLVGANGSLYFVADDGKTGHELFWTDGSNTKQVREIVPGPGSAQINHMVASGNRVFFTADALSGTGREPWVSDGTPGGTKMITDLYLGVQGSNPYSFAGIRGGAVFIAIGTFGGVKLYFTDGTAAGTVQLHGAIIPDGVVVSDGRFAYVAGRSPATGFEPIRTDGTPAGTILVKDIRPGSLGGGFGSPAPVPGGGVTFAADDGVHGGEPWFSDGQTAVMLADASRPPSAATDSSSPEQVASEFLHSFFVADDGRTGAELWRVRTNLTVEQVGEVNPGPAGGNIRFLTVDYNDKAYFAATDAEGEELWMADHNGIRRLSTLPGTTGTFIREIVATARRVFFTALDTVHGMELWVHDHDSNRTYPIDILPGPSSSSPMELTRVGDWVFFRARDLNAGRSLFRTKGTAAETELVAVPLVAQSGARNLVAAGSKLFFTANTPSDGEELYCAEEAPQLTVHRLGTLQPGTGAFGIKSRAGTAHGRLFFSFNDGKSGEELWVSDGSQRGTHLVADVRPGTAGIAPDHVTAVGDHVFFTAFTPAEGVELWYSDGTQAGTRMVQDFVLGSGGSEPDELRAAGDDQLVCTLFTTSHGRELWSMDLAGGARRLTDINPGPASSDPGSFAVQFGKDLVFAATDPLHGREPYVIDLDGSSVRLGEGCTAMASMRRPVATTNTPRLGKAMTLTIYGFGPNVTGLVAIGEPVPAFPLGPCYAHVNPAGMILLPVRTDAGGAAGFSLTIPNDTRLINVQIVLQGVAPDTQHRIEISDARLLTVGT